MATDASFKIFTSRNGAGDVPSSEMSCLGELPLIRSKAFGGAPKKPVATFFNKSTLKNKSTKRANRTKNAAQMGQSRNGNCTQQDLNYSQIKPNCGPVNGNLPTENKDENKPKMNLNKTVQQHIAAAKKNACNISVMRQTLRANNKALAVALEIAKQEIKELKDENLLLTSLNQEFQTRLNRYQDDISSYEQRFDQAVETCVKMKLDEIVEEFFNEFSELIDDTKQRMIKMRRKYTKNDGDTTLKALNDSCHEKMTNLKNKKSNENWKPDAEDEAQDLLNMQISEHRLSQGMLGSNPLNVTVDLFVEPTPEVVDFQIEEGPSSNTCSVPTSREIEIQQTLDDKRRSTRRKTGTFFDDPTPRMKFKRSRYLPAALESPAEDDPKSRPPSFLGDPPEPLNFGANDQETTGIQGLRRSRRTTLMVDYKETKPNKGKPRHGERTVRRKKPTETA